jgi:carbon-monoxide dehydrogenase medium subunit
VVTKAVGEALQARANDMSHFVGLRAIPNIEYHRPKTLKHALQLMHDFRGNGRLIAGGTDLITGLRQGTIPLAEQTHIVDIGSVNELNHIKREDNTLSIGAGTPLSEIQDSIVINDCLPVLADAVSRIGSLQIRNQGTIGGNLCNASPAADTAPPLLIFDAKGLARSVDKERTVPLHELFSGPGQTTMAPDEILVEVQIPIPKTHEHSCFIKLGRRNAFTLSIVSVATSVTVEDGVFKDVKVALGAVAPTPMRISTLEQFLIGQEANESLIDDGAKKVTDEIQPITDVRASAEYRKEMSYILTRRAIISCIRSPKES